MFFLLNKTVLFFNGNVGAMLAELIKGPVRCPSVRRNSASVHRLRQAGISIHTELIRGEGASRVGIYHLRSKVRRVSADELATMRKKAKAEKKAVSK